MAVLRVDCLRHAGFRLLVVSRPDVDFCGRCIRSPEVGAKSGHCDSPLGVGRRAEVPAVETLPRGGVCASLTGLRPSL